MTTQTAISFQITSIFHNHASYVFRRYIKNKNYVPHFIYRPVILPYKVCFLILILVFCFRDFYLLHYAIHICKYCLYCHVFPSMVLCLIIKTVCNNFAVIFTILLRLLNDFCHSFSFPLIFSPFFRRSQTHQIHPQVLKRWLNTRTV
jgi:hypothetical protein